MSEPETLIDEYYSLRPTHFTVLKSLTISQGIGSDGACEQSLVLILSKELSISPSLTLTFQGVRNLILQQPVWSQISIGHLEIVAGDTIPTVYGRYLVRDPEQERIVWFECMDFKASLV